MADTVELTPEQGYNEALFALHCDLDEVDFLKESTGQVQSRNYKYQDLPSLMKALRPHLRKHGFYWTSQPAISNDGEPSLIFKLTHKAGFWRGGEALLMSKASTPQDQGSAITYMRRYSISSFLDIVSEEDDDGKKSQDAVSAPMNAATKNGILILLDKLGRTQAEQEKKLGKALDKLSEGEGQELGSKLVEEVKTNAQ